MRYGGFLVAAIGLAAVSMPIEARPTQSPIFELLRSHGFSRPLDASTMIRRLGTVTGSNRRYDVFYYVHTGMAAKVRHGRQSLIFVENGTRYVGAYEANMAKCAVRRNVVVCRENAVGVQFIRLSRGLPPAEVLIGGQVSKFYK